MSEKPQEQVTRMQCDGCCRETEFTLVDVHVHMLCRTWRCRECGRESSVPFEEHERSVDTGDGLDFYDT